MKDRRAIHRRLWCGLLVGCLIFGLEVDVAQATSPGSNRRLAFLSDGDSRGARLRETSLRERTTSSLLADSGAIDGEWSPDGSRLAVYTRKWKKRIYLFNPRTHDRDLVLALSDIPEATDVFSMSFSPTGNQLLVCTDDSTGRPTLYKVSLDGAPVDSIADRPLCYADWASDGRIVATAGGTGEVRRLAILGEDGSNFRIIVRSERGYLGHGLAVAPTWMPDSSTIIYSAAVAKQRPNLWSVDPTGGAPTRLTETPRKSEYAPVPSPDGRYIAFAQSPGRVFSPAPVDLFALDLSSSSTLRLTRSRSFAEFPRSWRSGP